MPWTMIRSNLIKSKKSHQNHCVYYRDGYEWVFRFPRVYDLKDFLKAILDYTKGTFLMAVRDVTTDSPVKILWLLVPLKTFLQKSLLVPH